MPTKREEILKKILHAAKADEKKRHDRRYLDALGFLVAKGFLRINTDMRPLPNKRLQIDDVLWAGQNVEPRILEVLPAAILRLPNHFDLNPTHHKELALIIHLLKHRTEEGPSFLGIPYRKLKVWVDFELKDGRVKQFNEKKRTKTFRLSLASIQKLKDRANEEGCSETEILERAISGR